MTIRFEIYPDRPDTIPDVTARVQAVRKEIQDEIRGLVLGAVREGQRVAEIEAPRGPILERNEGRRIADSIRISEVRYAPGGAGGGGFFEADVYASSLIAPHLPFVMSGTADEGRGLIRPARGNILAIQKEGEDVHYRAWVHGQRPNTRWWDAAREATERVLSAGVESIK